MLFFEQYSIFSYTFIWIIMSAYGRLHELKIREKDYVLSCEQTRQ